ncbi:hypothetical protein ADL22_12545 [Streptomyces sp. NRRL F-4489]|uniref:tyrosine-type recombinase/integrase n=1 Tax=Streptomyces sp. NRRL F-4489 TaxID=1609095 RepID=UPI000746BDA4|nr:tyrosine-type recombinase/integrase [Streptomyces sp. NRRL F-4489]KUL44765.1 hypothetical protein ADL22_12545 [Streptomyces sp. NRRL F-4489]
MTRKISFKRAERAVREWLETKVGRTQEEYERDITRYIRHCAARDVDPLRARPDTAATFLRALEVDYGLAPRTRRRAFSVVSAFYTYAIRWRYARQNPFTDVAKPQPSGEPALGMSMEESVAVLTEAFDTSDRLYALVTTLLLLGLRISELLGADIEDIGTVAGQRVLWIKPKGGDDKIAMPLPDAAFAALDAYLGDRTTGPIFVTRSGRRLSRSGAYDTIVRMARRAGVTRLFPHLLRATTTVLLLQLGQALERVQEVMRHRDIRTTIGYDRAARRLQESPVFALEQALFGRVA